MEKGKFWLLFLYYQMILLDFHRFPLTAALLRKRPGRRNCLTASVLPAALRTHSQSMPAVLCSVLRQRFSAWAHKLLFKDWQMRSKKIHLTVKEASLHHTAICAFTGKSEWICKPKEGWRSQEKTNRVCMCFITALFAGLSYIYLM